MALWGTAEPNLGKKCPGLAGTTLWASARIPALGNQASEVPRRTGNSWDSSGKLKPCLGSSTTARPKGQGKSKTARHYNGQRCCPSLAQTRLALSPASHPGDVDLSWTGDGLKTLKSCWGRPAYVKPGQRRASSTTTQSMPYPKALYGQEVRAVTLQILTMSYVGIYVTRSIYPFSIR